MGINDSGSTPLRTNIAGALFTATQQRVLGLLYGQPKRSFAVTELIAEARGGAGAVQRELVRLEQAGLIQATRNGRQKLLQANRESPIFKELSRIVQKTMMVKDPLITALQPLSARIVVAFLYGSIARQTDHAQSDIDMLIVSDSIALSDIYTALDPVEKKLGRPIKPTIYTAASIRKRLEEGQGFMAQVMQQPKQWLIGDQATLDKALAATPPSDRH